MSMCPLESSFGSFVDQRLKRMPLSTQPSSTTPVRFWWIWLSRSMPPFFRAVGPSTVLALTASHSGPPRAWIANTPVPASFAFFTNSRKLREDTSEAGKTCVALMMSAARAGAAQAAAQPNPSAAAKKRALTDLLRLSRRRAASYHPASDDGLFRIRAHRPRARREALPSRAARGHRVQLRRCPEASRLHFPPVSRGGIRNGSPRGAAAAELPGVPAALPRAQLHRRRGRAGQSRLPR